MRPTRIRKNTVRSVPIIMDGGLNENVSSIEMKGGELLSCTNYELVEGSSGGYRSIAGYERYDGNTKPSSIAATDEDHTDQDTARAAIGEVPGEGNVLGVHLYNNKVYAFRNKTGGATAGMYVESASGWVEVNTSAAPLAPDGEYSFVNYNFYATATSYAMYWSDGVNKARSFDGTTIVVITTTETTDTPLFIAAHSNRLFLSFAGGLLDHSNLGDPTDWSTGAGQYGTGQDITALTAGVGNALVIHCRNQTWILNGTIPDDWKLERFSDMSGAYSYTVNRMLGTIFFMDDRGITSLSAVQDFGDFASNSISQRVKRTLLENKDFITAATVSRDLNQYRLFASGGGGLVFSFLNKKLRGVTSIEYPDPVLSVTEGEDDLGNNLIFFTSSGGYVYQMDSGTSFDGVSISTRMATAYYHYGSPRNWKRFQRLTFEIASVDAMDLNIRTDFDYRDPIFPRAIDLSISVLGSGARWGEGKWGTMRWSGSEATNRIPFYLQGIGSNMSLNVWTDEAYKGQHTIQNFISDFSLIGRQA